MVLRGRPVGEQGAADRWTALDPYIAGSGAGAPRGGSPSAAPPFFLSLSPYRSAEGPAGPFSMPRFIFLMPVLSIYWDFAIRGNAGLL